MLVSVRKQRCLSDVDCREQPIRFWRTVMHGIQSLVLSRQAPLRALYQEHPERAVIYKHVCTHFQPSGDPLHGTVAPGDYGVAWSFGIDRAVGGMHDLPNPGEMLCAALAACQDSTIRMLADILGVKLQEVTVEVVGKLDVRGCLMVDRAAAVGFESLECRVSLRAAAGTPVQLVQKLLAQAETSCINLATLRSGVDVHIALHDVTERTGTA
jgi:uncharacterized OsmC-like protein